MTAADVHAWVEQLRTTSAPDDEAACVDVLRALEELTCAAAGLQADAAAVLDTKVREREAARGVPQARRGRGVAAQVALATRTSHHRGQRRLGLAKILATEMPFTREALRAGHITEWKATILARETACLSRQDRAEVDRRIAGDPRRVEGMGDRELEHAARSLAEKLDVEAAVRRRRVAESERRVTLRPVPDTMCRVSAEVPVAAGVAVLKSLRDAADSARAAGDPRTRGQVMADTLVERVLGTRDAVPVNVDLLVSDEVLLGDRDDAAHLDGYGPIPAELARELVTRADQEGMATLRRLYRQPETGSLVALDSQTRCFPAGLARLIRLRDQICRTPWCDAPIRHTDHVVPAEVEGPTSELNGQGLCEACNHAKQAPGWRARPSPGPRHTVVLTTPSGHSYDSTAPPVPGRVLPVDFSYPLVLIA